MTPEILFPPPYPFFNRLFRYLKINKLQVAEKKGSNGENRQLRVRIQRVRVNSLRFTAEQAAQKRIYPRAECWDMFTAEQAAQKSARSRLRNAQRFTAEQAAQKYSLDVFDWFIKFTAEQAAQKRHDFRHVVHQRFTAEQAAQKLPHS